MRLFLAVKFDGRMQEALTDVFRELKARSVKGNYTPIDNLHMTLVFIGETDRVQEIKGILASIPVPTMQITLSRLSMFGNMLVARMKGNEGLKEYVANVRTALDGVGIAFDHKRFNPHVTLVRKAAGGNLKDIQCPMATMPCTHVSLMKSVRKDGRMVYTEIAGYNRNNRLYIQR